MLADWSFYLVLNKPWTRLSLPQSMCSRSSVFGCLAVCLGREKNRCVSSLGALWSHHTHALTHIQKYLHHTHLHRPISGSCLCVTGCGVFTTAQPALCPDSTCLEVCPTLTSGCLLPCPSLVSSPQDTPISRTPLCDLPTVDLVQEHSGSL